MIHYQLRCAADHEFDGWFRNSQAFATQAQANLVECPACGSTAVSRALMAPALSRKTNARKANAHNTGTNSPVVDQQGQPAPPPAPVPSPAPAAASLPDNLRAMLQKLRTEVETRCEHVGPRFAEEARAIHNGEKAARGIYGEATPEQAEALKDDGIDIARIPWVPRADG